jgi:NADH:ubiquinone oxidoreductase subunit
MTLGIRIFTWLNGALVGTDADGNRYYRDKRGRALVKGGGIESRERRWVIYAGVPEASKVPAEWHGWLHHTTSEMPAADDRSRRRPWQKDHVQNLTGTPGAYHPPGSVLAGGKRPKATGDYEPWVP